MLGEVDDVYVLLLYDIKKEFGVSPNSFSMVK